MDESGSRRWIGTAVAVGVAYFLIGFLFGGLAGAAATNHERVTWRLAAWLVSALVFAAHIGYEQTRQGSSAASTAQHTAAAVALGAFGIAVAAMVHSLAVGSGRLGSHLIALVAWPALTGLGAYVVAYGGAWVLALRRSLRG
jgi:hypothetical protein